MKRRNFIKIAGVGSASIIATPNVNMAFAIKTDQVDPSIRIINKF